jgi:hypothetical protein
MREKIETSDPFTPDNHSYGERDFGAFEHNGQRVLWEIVSFDPTLTEGSENPTDPVRPCACSPAR